MLFCRKGGDGLDLRLSSSLLSKGRSSVLVGEGGLVEMSVVVVISLVSLLGCGFVGLLASGDFKHSNPRRALLLSGSVAAIGVGTGIALLIFC